MECVVIMHGMATDQWVHWSAKAIVELPCSTIVIRSWACFIGQVEKALFAGRTTDQDKPIWTGVYFSIVREKRWNTCFMYQNWPQFVPFFQRFKRHCQSFTAFWTVNKCLVTANYLWTHLTCTEKYEVQESSIDIYGHTMGNITTSTQTK